MEWLLIILGGAWLNRVICGPKGEQTDEELAAEEEAEYRDMARTYGPGVLDDLANPNDPEDVVTRVQKEVASEY